MIRVFYDTEFIEDGKTIELISIGMVNSRGEEYYAVNNQINGGDANYKIRRHRFLMENVIPHLPLRSFIPIMEHALEDKGWFEVDTNSPEVRSRQDIVDGVTDFLLRHNEPLELWAYYGSYDHVVMSWLWGPMIYRPKGIPMFSFDLMQYAAHKGLDDSTFPKQEGTLHNALEDARWNKKVHEYLSSVEGM